jgi:hypothetical protein
LLDARERKKMTHRAYHDITPGVCFLEGLVWFYDGITPRLDLQPLLLAFIKLPSDFFDSIFPNKGE